MQVLKEVASKVEHPGTRVPGRLARPPPCLFPFRRGEGWAVCLGASAPKKSWGACVWRGEAETRPTVSGWGMVPMFPELSSSVFSLPSLAPWLTSIDACCAGRQNTSHWGNRRRGRRWSGWVSSNVIAFFLAQPCRPSRLVSSVWKSLDCIGPFGEACATVQDGWPEALLAVPSSVGASRGPGWRQIVEGGRSVSSDGGVRQPAAGP